jgi:hypothetical protein
MDVGALRMALTESWFESDVFRNHIARKREATAASWERIVVLRECAR